MRTHAKRLDLIDFLRGVAVLEMVTAHFAGFLPEPLAKLVAYTETAMALFVLLAGFMVGWQSPRFERNPGQHSRQLWYRALQIVAVQYIIIVTVGVPLHVLGMPGVGSQQPLWLFVLQSMLFLNQVSLIHILPTFVPLLLIAPAILLGMMKKLDAIVLMSSAALFVVGHFRPHLLDLGQPTIFPFILFQLYFVAGCFIGRNRQVAGVLVPQAPGRYLAASFAAMLVTMFVIHGKLVPAGTLSTHPLNLVGLTYHVPIISVVVFSVVTFWSHCQRVRIFPIVTRFGRHPLLAFTIHLYLAKTISVIDHFANMPAPVTYVLMALSVVAMDVVLRAYEARLGELHPTLWVRATRSLFR